jgi:trehalose 6-phosphate synthase
MKQALLSAYRADDKELSRRMRAMRKTVTANDVSAWARSFLDSLNDLKPAHGKIVRPAQKS